MPTKPGMINPQERSDNAQHADEVLSKYGRPECGSQSLELIKLIDDAQVSLTRHFEQVRLQIRQLEKSLAGSASDREVQAVADLLQAEREQLAQQRVLEQEQIRSAMQQLADAWLRLESEQIAQLEKQQARFANGKDLEIADLENLVSWNRDNSPSGTQQQYENRGNTIADLGFETASSPSRATDAKGSEELFHRLRMDLRRHASGQT